MPTPGLIDTEVAPVTFQDRVELCPPWIDGGLAVKASITGLPPSVTVTARVAVLWPVAFVAVSVYVVVAAGETETEVPTTVPTTGLIDTDVAPVTLHDRTALCPAWMDGGLAANDSIVGGVDPGSVLAPQAARRTRKPAKATCAM